MNLGLSEHHAQILSIPIIDSRIKPFRIRKRHFSKSNHQEFFHSLYQVIWQEVYEETDVNIKFGIFVGLFLRCYNNAFPIKTVCVRD